MMTDIQWVHNYLSQIIPRGQELVFIDPLRDDECRWFRAAIENEIIEVRKCIPECPTESKGKRGSNLLLALAFKNNKS